MDQNHLSLHLQPEMSHEVVEETLVFCGGVEDVQSVLTLFCSGAAQVFHALRVVERKEQLEVEEEDGDRQGKKRSRKWRSRIKESAHVVVHVVPLLLVMML